MRVKLYSFSKFAVISGVVLFILKYMYMCMYSRESYIAKLPGHNPSKTGYIPKILHQQWKNADIPVEFSNWTRSWRQNHPGWQFWLWVNEDIRGLIRTKYPKYLQIYDDYPEDIYRADIGRYAIMHEYGGWYSDLDVESLKPLDTLNQTYKCILPLEPAVHSYLYYRKAQIISNALFGCVPKHTFFEHIMYSIPRFAKKLAFMGNKKTPVTGVTGPEMFQTVFEYWKQKMINSSVVQNIWLASDEYFMPVSDQSGYWMVRGLRCCGEIPPCNHDLCQHLRTRDWQDLVTQESYTNHHWTHTYSRGKALLSGRTFNVFDRFPGTKHPPGAP